MKSIEVYYDSRLENWDEVIDRELERKGLNPGEVTVIALPKQKQGQKNAEWENSTRDQG
jgi:hypothetical protein